MKCRYPVQALILKSIGKGLAIGIHSEKPGGPGDPGGGRPWRGEVRPTRCGCSWRRCQREAWLSSRTEGGEREWPAWRCSGGMEREKQTHCSLGPAPTTPHAETKGVMPLSPPVGAGSLRDSGERVKAVVQGQRQYDTRPFIFWIAEVMGGRRMRF